MPSNAMRRSRVRTRCGLGHNGDSLGCGYNCFAGGSFNGNGDSFSLEGCRDDYGRNLNRRFHRGGNRDDWSSDLS